MTSIKNFLRADEGVTALEYGLIAALVAVVIIAGLNILGPALNDTFTTVGNDIQNAGG